MHRLNRLELHPARELSQAALDIAQGEGSPYLLAWAHQIQGATLNLLGEFAMARSDLDQAIHFYFYDPQEHRVYRGVQDTGVSALGHMSTALWMLGYPDQALQKSREALTLAQQLSHPYMIAFALAHVSGIHAYRREVQAVLDVSQALMALAAEHGFASMATGAKGRLGQAWVAQGRVVEGITLMRQQLTAKQAEGNRTGMDLLLSQLAAAYGTAGQPQEGLTLLDEALRLADQTSQRWWEAESQRMKGELLLVQAGHRPQGEEAAACFQQGLAIARRQQAKSWELRAATSLARLWQSQDTCQAAADLLAPVYGWFTEGFDTADLQEAKGLLEELE